MASIKDLKKSVKAISDYYASSAGFLQDFSNNDQQEKLTEIIVELYNLESDTLAKIQESRKTEKPLKKHFSALIDSYNERLNKVDEKLSSLEEEVFNGLLANAKEVEGEK